MTYLPIHAHYHASRLLAAGTGEEAFTRSLSSARVEMNPHQVDAALFALRSPLSKGVMLADEVGLGKTIEAGLVMSQRWAEQRRRMLLVVPASLRKQWSQELWDKFGLKSRIIEAKTFGDLVRGGQARPFEMDGAITIVSYDFAARKADAIRAAHWDLVVFDEAHRMRNVWKKDGAKGAKALKAAVGDRFKIMLTATPLQNSLMELYGLVSILDETHFGGANAFRTQFVLGGTPASQEMLRQRLSSICHRTLRRQVQEAGHINFRKRHALTFTFEPYDEEARLYEMLSEYLQDTTTIAYGGTTNALVLLQARKQLGSSTFATAQYLTSLLERLQRAQRASSDMTDDLEDALADEVDAAEGEEEGPEAPVDPAALADEIALVAGMRDLALSIGVNAKGDKLLSSLPQVLDEIEGIQPGGVMAGASFGPVNGEGGERRLNVLFTRARLRCEVFASFDPAQLDVSRATQPGPRILKRFLDYAQNGRTEQPTVTGEAADTPFEEDVAEVVRSLGYLADPQVGSAGFRIDIGVRHPDRPGTYLLAIECDGATYHSALWARERDRLRQDVLEHLGWRFHRIWSTDWFYDRRAQVERLRVALSEARDANGAPPEAHADVPPSPKPEPDRSTPLPEPLSRQMPAYARAFPRAARSMEPHEAPLTILVPLVKEVVAVEGPVHLDEVARRIAAAFGKKSAGRRVVAATLRALDTARRQGADLRHDAEDFWFTAAQEVQPPVRNRSAESGATIKAEALSLLEIEAAVSIAREDNPGSSGGDLIRAAGRLLGFHRIGADLHSRLAAGIVHGAEERG